jgi:1-phosphofructokinase
MAAELGAWPILCSFLGGETGAMLLPLLQALPGGLRIANASGATGAYVNDRRGGERRLIASTQRPAPQRHEVDDLVSGAVAAALGATLVVLCNPFPAEGFPDEAYELLAGDLRAAGVPVLADLSSPWLDRVLPYEPDLVKLNDWELAGYVRGPVDGPRALAAVGRLRDAGARSVAVTRAGGPILVVSNDDDPFEITPPSFPVGHREGCGDTMMGAIAAGWARGMCFRDALVLGVAAGSVNFLRRGLGTGRRAAVEELASRIDVRPLAA